MSTPPTGWKAGHAPTPRFGSPPPQPAVFADRWAAGSGQALPPVHPSWQTAPPGWAGPPASVSELWAAPPPPRPAPGRAWWVVPLVVLALVLSAGVLRGYDTQGRGQSTRVTPSSVPSVTKAKPTTTTGRILMDNALYPLKLVGDCPGQTSPSSRAEYRSQVEALLRCLTDAYRPLIDKAGFDFRPVSHTYFGTSADSPCGKEHDAYAFYCEENSTIYLSQKVYDYAGDQRLNVAEVVIHEYNHHVQSMAGILNAEDRRNDSSAERRVELQSLCWTYYAFHTVRGFAITDDDMVWFDEVWADASDPEGHGSVDAQRLWGLRGLQGSDLAACNTWSAPPGEVR